MTNTGQGRLKKVAEAFCSLFLLTLIAAMAILNNFITEVAYGHVNTYSDSLLLFSEYSQNPIYKFIHLLSPINVLNFFLWGDNKAHESLIFSIITVAFIFIVLGYYKYKPHIVAVLVASILLFLGGYLLFDVIDSTLLLLLNCAFYATSIYFIDLARVKKKIYLSLLGGLFWLIPNIYQIVFLEGLYI